MQNELKGVRFPVLNHGHIILLDAMGSDQDVVDAARTAYQMGTKQVSDTRTLLRYLFRNAHTSPFECAVIKLHVKLPIFVERQWARHRTAGWNEVSARYSELPEEYYVPELETVCEQSGTNKQGRGDAMPEAYAADFQQAVTSVAKGAFDRYHQDLEQKVARELARINLPLGTYTEKVWWINLKNMLGFLGLRMDSHAQWEIRQYANIIGEQIIKPLFPECYQAFLDYQLQAMKLSRLDIGVIQRLQLLRASQQQQMAGFQGAYQDESQHREQAGRYAAGIIQQHGSAWMMPAREQQFLEAQDPSWVGLAKCSERDECREKLKLLGLLS